MCRNLNHSTGSFVGDEEAVLADVSAPGMRLRRSRRESDLTSTFSTGCWRSYRSRVTGMVWLHNVRAEAFHCHGRTFFTFCSSEENLRRAPLFVLLSLQRVWLVDQDARGSRSKPVKADRE